MRLILASLFLAAAGSIAILRAGFVPVANPDAWLCGETYTTTQELLKCNQARCDSYRSDVFASMRDQCERLLIQYESGQCKRHADAADPNSKSSNNAPPTSSNNDPPANDNSAPGIQSTPPAPPPGRAEPSEPPRLPDCVPATS